MMKNFSIALAIVAVTFIGIRATSVSALTADEIQVQIQQLLAQLTELTKQLSVLRASQSTTSPDQVIGSAMPSKHRVCYLLTRNLTPGAQGDDVRGLQEFLNSEGYLSAQATGYFGPLTAEAVAKWQAREGVSAVGAFGPLSRERLKIWCGGDQWMNKERFSASPARGEAPLTVTFDTWLSGFRVNTISYTIDYGDGTSERAADCPAPADACTGPGQNKHTYSSNGTYTATLNKITDPCPDDGDPNTPRCMAAIHSEVVGKVQIFVGPQACTKEYKPVCGQHQIVCITTPCNPIQQTYGNRCEMNAAGATFLYEGQCRDSWPNPADDPRCKAWYDGCNSCSRSASGQPAMCTLRACMAEMMAKPYCTAWFDGTNANKPPVISSFSGPTTLAVNTSGTWTINASDPENGQLSYSMWWGDENVYAANMTAESRVAEHAFVQSTTFTHSYANAGMYTVIIIVRDSAGQQAKTSTTVKVGSEAVACTLQYDPVCGQPPEPACRHSTPACMMATPGPQTYSNKCFMNAAGATLIHEGSCDQGYACTADAYQCPNGNWVGRTGPNCQFVCN